MINHPWHTEAMRLDLTDEEAAALFSLLNRVIADHRLVCSSYCSPQVGLYKEINHIKSSILEKVDQ